MKKAYITTILLTAMLCISTGAFVDTQNTTSSAPNPIALVAMVSGFISLAGFVSRREERTK